MPRIGLLSDSHGSVEVTRRAVDLLLAANVDVLLHLGDICGEGVIDQLAIDGNAAGQPVQCRMVFGNCDWDEGGMTRYAEALDIIVDHPAGHLSLPEGELRYTHGHLGSESSRAISDGVRWLCYGHTHVRADDRRGGTRLINPGALHRAAQYTVAVLDSATDTLQFHHVPRA